MRHQITIALILILIVSISPFAFSASSTGKFSIGNEPPTASNLRVQDGASSWDSTAPLDTHDITPSFQWNLADPNPDTIKTKVCISDSPARNCNLVNDNSLTVVDTYTVADGKLSYPACGSSKTYYIDLTPNDGTVDGAKISTEFVILNSVPAVSNLVMTPSITSTTTHSQTPSFSWTATDADSGSIDHWPADTLTHTILVGDTCGGSQYLSGTNPAGGTASSIPWGAITGTQSIKNFCARIIATDNANCPASSDTPLQLIDNIPNPSTAIVKLSNDPLDMRTCSVPGASSPCWLNPNPPTYQSVNLLVTFDDLDTGDCPTDTVQVTLKHPDKDYIYDLVYDSSAGTSCIFKKSVPAGDSAGIEFFRAPPTSPATDFNMPVLITSQGNSLVPATFGWTIAPNLALSYPGAIDLGDPSGSPPSGCGGNDIQLGSWNPGLCLAPMSNWGNVVTTLTWEATDPSSDASTCSGNTQTCWDLNPATGGTDNLQVDDDTSQADDTGNLAAVNIPETTANIIFEPTGGLKVCTDLACSAPSEANLNTYFHILPPTGLSPGTYTTAITISTS